ncbi:HD-GYP domain-containing protein [Chitinibacter bivalviorum]|uniref:HD-GYP domain-containing protein n=1 Tax=Chitinibacter bivalviorum TaxID=2739434 RepID=A0A7H9BLR2_9NEIS|nr:HD-GYP domain-containing protein [Chitinibacter bivalviorum]QLG89617.1 HD-GYP domain-containing protein [Chitinibacter bivalviorum]
METRVHVLDLQLGLYVTELDRPWLDTPFLLQGFLIESQAQIEQLREYCENVKVDLSRSTGGLARWSSLVSSTLSHGAESFSAPTITALVQPQMDEKDRRERINVLRELRQLFSRFRSKNKSDAKGTVPFVGSIVLYEQEDQVEVELPKAQAIHLASREFMQSMMKSVRQELQPKIEEATSIVNDMVNSIIRNPNALLLLTQLKDRDQYSYSHSIDTAVYLLAFGRHLGYPVEELQKLGLAGLMLDIGKVKLPEELLSRTGRFTQGEFMLMKTHVKHSLDILGQMDSVPTDVFDMVARHHERYDGSGYPNGLKAEEIGIFGSMAGIVDCFTALTSERSYSDAKPPHEALQLLYKWSERYFHPALVEQFAQCIGIFHVGTLVELSTGEVGIVIGQNRVRRLKPKLMIILGSDKKPYAQPHTLDLITNPSAPNGLPISLRRELSRGAYNIDPREYFLE